MIWKFIDTGSNSGKFNMDFDLELARHFSGSPVLRVYKWKPFCISLGANQDFNSVDRAKVLDDGIEIVKRPTGGRAILHSQELTYSVVYPLSADTSPKQIYREINLALKIGLINYNAKLAEVELEYNQPHFPSFYKEDKSTLCFAATAMNEINYREKKVVGSAQRKIGDTILQHGSILCGCFHKKITEYLNLPSEKIEDIKNEIDYTTTDLALILGEEIDYKRLAQSIRNGFENYFNIKFEEEIYSEINLQVI